MKLGVRVNEATDRHIVTVTEAEVPPRQPIHQARANNKKQGVR